MRNPFNTQIRLLPIALAAIAVVMTGCASAPAKPAAAGLDCNQLRSEIAQAELDKRDALEKQQGAWKVVVPFAVAARYASAKSQVGDADERLAELRAQFTQKSCANHG